MRLYCYYRIVLYIKDVTLTKAKNGRQVSEFSVTDALRDGEASDGDSSDEI